MQQPILQLKNISKSFFGVHALKNVSLDLYPGEVHIVCGENGAGKSTLMKIMSGLYHEDAGEIIFEGNPVKIETPKESVEMGIATIYQELSLSPSISIEENMFLSTEPGKFFVDKKQMRQKAIEYLAKVGLTIDPTTIVRPLSMGVKQLVQIARALVQNPKVIIMDEPCSSITEEDTAKLFALINEIKKTGVAIVYIDHRINNFKMIGDRLTVLRDGEYIATKMLNEVDRDEIVKLMVGRDVSQKFPKTATPSDEVRLEVKGICNNRLKDISFSVRKGEVFGLAGLVGAGRTEIMRAIYGLDYIEPTGEIILDGNKIKNKTPLHSIKNNFAYIPEDRKGEGIITGSTITFNLALTNLSNMCKGPFVDDKLVRAEAEKQFDSLEIRSLNKDAFVKDLSGGNQQKVVIGRWLMCDGIKVFLMDEPTRGIDIGVKYELYKLIDSLASEGISVIVITSELPELLGLCDRIATIANGEITHIFNRDEFTQEKIMEKCI